MSVNHETKLVDCITNLMNCDSANDVRIKLSNGVEVKANRVILSAMSAFFKNQVKLKQTSLNINEKFVEIDLDVSSTKEMLELVVKYLYTEKMHFGSLELKDILDLIHLLFFLEMCDLAKEVERCALLKINVGGYSLEEVLKLSSTAEEFGLNQVVSSMLNYLDEHINDVSKLPEVQHLSSAFLEQLLDGKREKLSVIQSGLNDSGFQQSFSAGDERHFPRFVTMTTWLSSKNDVDISLQYRWLTMFELKRFTTQQLTTTVRESKLFSESSILDVLGQSVKNLEEKVEQLKEEKSSNKRKFEATNATLKKEIQNGLSYKEKIDKLEQENKRLRTKVPPPGSVVVKKVQPAPPRISEVPVNSWSGLYQHINKQQNK